jgi:5'-methylthioadenosine nucleosidase
MFSNICFIIAMKAEAQQLINHFNLKVNLDFAPELPMRHWEGLIGSTRLNIVINGEDPMFKLDLIGTQAATLATHLAMNNLKPDLIISAGTAGAFAENGASIGEVFLSYPHIVYHDRRIAIPGWDKMGIGSYKVFDTLGIANALGMKTAIVTTGNSLDMPPQDEETIRTLNGEIKEMEAAAVAWVASLYNTPVFCLKSVTDLVDIPHPNHEQFQLNLKLAVNNLTLKCIDVINFLIKS